MAAAKKLVSKIFEKCREFSIKFRWELFKDFFWEMDYYNSQDSQASATGNSTSDYGIITSLGWSF